MNAPFNIAEQRKTLRGYDRILATVEFARIEASKSPIARALENGGAYVMTMDDFLDRFPGAAPLVRTDAVTGRRYAFHALGEFALDVPLCSCCDHPLPLTAHCKHCDEDMSR